MVSKSANFKSVSLTTDDLVSFVRFLEGKVQKGKFSRLELMLSLKNGETYDLDSSDEIKTVLSEEIMQLASVRIKFYTEKISIGLEDTWAGYRLRVSAETRDELIVIIEKLKKILVKRKSYNWLAQGGWVYVVGTILTVFLSISIYRKYVPYKTRQRDAVIFAVLSTAVAVLIGLAIRIWLSKRYPRLLIAGNQEANGKDVRDDWYKIIGAVLLPIAVGLFVSLIS